MKITFVCGIMKVLIWLSLLVTAAASVKFWKPSMKNADETVFPTLGSNEDKFHLEICKMYQFTFEGRLKELFTSIKFWANSYQFARSFVSSVKGYIYPTVLSEFDKAIGSWRELIPEAVSSMMMLSVYQNESNEEERERSLDSYLDKTVDRIIDRYIDEISPGGPSDIDRSSESQEEKMRYSFIDLDFSFSKEIEEELDKVDHELLGGFFAELAYSNGFACFRIQRLSQIVYQLSRIGLLKAERLAGFLRGFMKALLGARKRKDEQQIRRNLLYRFVSLNMSMFLELEEDENSVIINLLNKQPELFIKDFTGIYTEVMGFVREFDMNLSKDVSVYSIESTKTLISNALSHGLVLTTMFGISIAKAYTLDKIPAPLGFVAEYFAIDSAIAKLDEAMRKGLGIYEDPESKEIKKVIEAKSRAQESELESTSEHLSDLLEKLGDENAFFKTANLKKFTENFEKMVCTAEDCVSCKNYALLDYSLRKII